VRDAEKLYCKIGDLMCLVEDNCLGAGQELDETAFFHREIRKQQVVIDDDQVGFLCRAPGLYDMAIGVLRTFLPEAIVRGRCDEWPDRRIFGDV
jgi:hypothetical protein